MADIVSQYNPNAMLPFKLCQTVPECGVLWATKTTGNFSESCLPCWYFRFSFGSFQFHPTSRRERSTPDTLGVKQSSKKHKF